MTRPPPRTALVAETVAASVVAAGSVGPAGRSDAPSAATDGRLEPDTSGR